MAPQQEAVADKRFWPEIPEEGREVGEDERLWNESFEAGPVFSEEEAWLYSHDPGVFHTVDGSWSYGAMQIDGNRVNVEIVPNTQETEEYPPPNFLLVRHDEAKEVIGRAWVQEIPDGAYFDVVMNDASRFRLVESEPGEWNMNAKVPLVLVREQEEMPGIYPGNDGLALFPARDKDGPDMDLQARQE